MAVRELVSEFEARRVERMLRSLWPGLLRADEALRVLRGVEQAGWVEVTWELADQQRRSVYRVDARIERKGPVRGQELADRQARSLRITSRAIANRLLGRAGRPRNSLAARCFCAVKSAMKRAKAVLRPC
jgi:hypothetical protein